MASAWCAAQDFQHFPRTGWLVAQLIYCLAYQFGGRGLKQVAGSFIHLNNGAVMCADEKECGWRGLENLAVERL
nr:hypothetical protein [Noviherbaspirillum pedocola]